MNNVELFVLPQSLLEKLVAHALCVAPKESVSIISGIIQNNKVIAEKVYSPKNTDNSTISFTVDPLELLEIYLEIEKEEKYLIGIYHTHPAPPVPSGIDVQYMEVNPYIWLISSMSKPEKPKGYLLLENKQLKEIKIEILEQ
ncbi:MAG: Mov34/MPN/PAD-1 family protein [Candidatus Thorarchaeota archaeon]